MVKINLLSRALHLPCSIWGGMEVWGSLISAEASTQSSILGETFHPFFIHSLPVWQATWMIAHNNFYIILLTMHSSYVCCTSSEGLQCVLVFLYNVDAFAVQGCSTAWSDKCRSILLIPRLGVRDLCEIRLVAVIGINAALFCSTWNIFEMGGVLLLTCSLKLFKLVQDGFMILWSFLLVPRMIDSLSSVWPIESPIAFSSTRNLPNTLSSKMFVELADPAVHEIGVNSDEELQSLQGDNELAGNMDSSPVEFNDTSLKCNGFERLRPMWLVLTS